MGLVKGERTILQIIPAHGWTAFIRGKAEPRIFNSMALACWALVEEVVEVALSTDPLQIKRKVVGMVGEGDNVYFADKEDGFDSYQPPPGPTEITGGD
jgi:hypothetical protein